MKVVHVLYPGFTALDVVGVFQVLAAAPGVDPVFVALAPGTVADDTGHCPLHAAASFDDVPAADVVVVPGSDTGSEPDAAVMAWLRVVHPRTAWTASVGTGSICLAAAGLLEGGEAATHWASAEKLHPFGVRYSDQRVVRHGNVITAAGSSAGLDMALTLLGLTHGPAVAQAVQLAIQYDPDPPFDAGSPAKAPAGIGGLVHDYYALRS
ncbi:MAG: hypothetical protein QOH75_3804 [Actinomycetota bacterium]|jgi:transcriptional regulator GlxA family with amidase domain|nr:hypothetical protein [Actinomycetota bacterium]